MVQGRRQPHHLFYAVDRVQTPVDYPGNLPVKAVGAEIDGGDAVGCLRAHLSALDINLNDRRCGD